MLVNLLNEYSNIKISTYLNEIFNLTNEFQYVTVGSQLNSMFTDPGQEDDVNDEAQSPAAQNSDHGK
jgi:hypothetical protein